MLCTLCIFFSLRVMEHVVYDLLWYFQFTISNFEINKLQMYCKYCWFSVLNIFLKNIQVTIPTHSNPWTITPNNNNKKKTLIKINIFRSHKNARIVSVVSRVITHWNAIFKTNMNNRIHCTCVSSVNDDIAQRTL